MGTEQQFLPVRDSSSWLLASCEINLRRAGNSSELIERRIKTGGAPVFVFDGIERSFDPVAQLLQSPLLNTRTIAPNESVPEREAEHENDEGEQSDHERHSITPRREW